MILRDPLHHLKTYIQGIQKDIQQSTPTYINYFLHYKPLEKRKHIMTYFFANFQIQIKLEKQVFFSF